MVGRIIDGTNRTSSPLQLHNPANAGDLLFAVVFQNSAGVGSVTGLTAVYGAKQLGASVNRATPLSGLAVSGTGTDLAFSATASPGTITAAAAEFSGVTNTEDAAAGFGSTGSAATCGTGTVTTTTADCLLVAWLAGSAAIGTFSIDSGFTLVPQAGANRIAVAYKFVSAAGAANATWTWASATAAATGIHAFRLTTGIPRGDLGGHVSL